MGWTQKLRAVFGGRKWSFLDEEIVIDVPKTLYTKELATYSAISLIANAISQCEIKTYKNNAEVKDEDWYSINIQANPNESASEFWHKVVERMLLADPEMGALVFTDKGSIYCADSYLIAKEDPLHGDEFANIKIRNTMIDKNFNTRNCIVFKLESLQGNQVVRSAYAELDKLVAAAYQSYTGSAKPRWKFKVDSVEAGTADFQNEWETKLKSSIQKYVAGENQIYIEYNGRVLEPVSTGSSSSASDSISLINEVFDLVAKAYHIPSGLMTGGNTNVSDLVSQFLTFAVDPVADMIGKTLTGFYGYENYSSGNFYKVDTSKVKHFDVFGAAADVDKLISSGFASINEVRKAADWPVIGSESDEENYANQHVLTKNYETMKGGENNERETEEI